MVPFVKVQIGPDSEEKKEQKQASVEQPKSEFKVVGIVGRRDDRSR